MNAADLATLTASQRTALKLQHQSLRRQRTIARYWRVSHSDHRKSPLGAGSGSSRFSPRVGPPDVEPPFKVLYLAENLTTALYERIVRDRFDLFPDRVLQPEHYSDFVAFEISSGQATALTLLDLTGDNAVMSGIPNDVIRYSRHDAGQHFAEYVHADMPEVHGILYESRFTRHRSVAVFDHAFDLLDHADTHDLDRELVHAALWQWGITVL